MGIAELHRARIVHAMARLVCEQGFAGASVPLVCERADVSRRAFYELFDDREQCFLAVLDEGHGRASTLMSDAFERADEWIDGMRLALAELLCCFDAEPHLGRACIVESLAAGRWALERRERHLASLTSLILGRRQISLAEPYPLASSGAVASVLAIVQRHMLDRTSEPLIALLGPLMGAITAPYLDGAAVAEEVRRGGELVQSMLATRIARARHAEESTIVAVPRPLLDPRAHRARGCVLYLADNPGASNRQIAQATGVGRDTHVSTLLARLAAMGLLVKEQARPGGSNAWRLTVRGQSVALALRETWTKKPFIHLRPVSPFE